MAVEQTTQQSDHRTASKLQEGVGKHQQQQISYLGITISVKNSDLDMKRQTRKMYANVNFLLRKFSKCSVGVKCFLFKTYCSSLYCAPMWFDCTKTALKRLKIAYNNLRRVMFLP